MKTDLKFGGVFEYEIIGLDGKVRDSFKTLNKVVYSGINYLLNAATGAGSTSQTTTYKIGLLDANYTIVDGTVMTNLAANELPAASFTEAVRQAWTIDGASSSQSLTNSNSKAVFTAAANIDVYGAFIVIGNYLTPENTSGIALCANNFGQKSLLTGEKITVQYTLSGTSS